MDKSKPASTQVKLEVLIPMRKTYASVADNIQKAKDYMIGTNPITSKRKRNCVPDSDEDDLTSDFSNARRICHDEKVARQLQAELDREAAETLEAQDAFITNNDDNYNDYDDYDDGNAQQQVVGASDSEDHPMASRKGKGKAVANGPPQTADRKGKGKALATRPPRAARAAARKYTFSDSDEDDPDDEFVDDIGPPTKKPKTVVRGRRKQVPAKGKQPVVALSEPDNDVSGKLQISSLDLPSPTSV